MDHLGEYKLRITMPVGLKLLCLLLAILFASTGICQGHPEVHPLSSLRHERATVKFGKSQGELGLTAIELGNCGLVTLLNIMLASSCRMKDVHADCHDVFFPLPVAEHSIQFSVYPDVLNISGDWTKVYWNYVPNPSAGDWVGLFLVASNTSMIDPTHHAPTKYQVSQSRSSGMVKVCQILYRSFLQANIASFPGPASRFTVLQATLNQLQCGSHLSYGWVWLARSSGFLSVEAEA